LTRTEVDRVLTATRETVGRLSTLSDAVDMPGVPREIEISKTDAFHERLVIPDAVPLLMHLTGAH
jgi:hypothetical protein